VAILTASHSAMERILKRDLEILSKPMKQPKKIAATIHLSKEGPIRVEGKFYIVNLEGESLTDDDTKEVYLCTCGASGSKPFCDGSHKAVKNNP